jgi:methenyltetrahydrofolate cyclohydrolase
MAGSTAQISSLSLAALAAAVDSEDPTPGGGTVAACTAALACALAGMAARYSIRGSAGPGPFAALADRAAALRASCLRLADDDAAAYGSYAAALRMPKEPDPRKRHQALRSARDAAAAVPLELAETAAELTRLAEQLARDGNRHLRSDAATAALLAAAVASSAAIFVADNLGGSRDDPRITRARGAAAEADAAAQRSVAMAEGGLERKEETSPQVNSGGTDARSAIRYECEGMPGGLANAPTPQELQRTGINCAGPLSTTERGASVN